MIAVDTSALMAIVLGEPERETILEILDSTEVVMISHGTLIEVRMVCYRRGGEGLVTKLDRLIAAMGIDIVMAGPREVDSAHQGCVRFGKGSGHPAQLSFGDLFSYALAKSRGMPLLFKGAGFARTDLTPALAR